MTRKAKIAVTLDEQVVDSVRNAVARGKAASVSAFVQEALEVHLLNSQTFREMLDEALESSGGPVTDEERAEIRRIAAEAKAAYGPRNP